MDKRENYDLSHFSYQTGDIGRLRTLSHIPVLAGDSMEISLQGVMRLSPLRRWMVLDVVVDTLAFYIPHRHIYSGWVDFIKQGIDETTTFISHNLPLDCSALALPRYADEVSTDATIKVPLWISDGYRRIWNRYFKHPIDPDLSHELFYGDGASATPYLDTSADGRLCCNLKRPWSTLMPQVSGHHEVTAAGGKFDILDLAKVRKNYKTEVDRQYFGQRYNDLLEKVWHTNVNIDADERPELLMRTTSMLSGHDIDGTADATLGTFSGKSAGRINFRMPRKHFAEHGCLWVVQLLRFPPLYTREAHPLYHNLNPAFMDIAPDPSIMAVDPPRQFDAEHWFASAATSTLVSDAYIPSHQQWRSHPSFINDRYRKVDGFPFLQNPGPGDLLPKVRNDYVYIDKESYGSDDAEARSVFQSNQLDQYQVQSHLQVSAMRYVPPALSSIYAGS